MEERRPWDYMFDKPPLLLIIFWVLGPMCALGAAYFTIQNIRGHRAAAEMQGFGKDELIPSMGVRADRVIGLLLAPLLCALVSVVQMFMPGISEIMELLRSCQFAFEMTRFLEFMFLLNGSQQNMITYMPRKPFKIFNSPPLCCFFAWPCCAFQPRAWHLKIFARGLWQFAWVLPLAGAADAYLGQNEPVEGRRGAAAEGGAHKILTVLVTASTLYAMYSLKCVWPFLTSAILEGEPLHDRLVHIRSYMQYQMMALQMLGKLLKIFVRMDLSNGTWVMPNAIFVNIVNAFVLCVIYLLISLVGVKAFPHGEGMYPAPDFEAGLPPDSLAMLDMNGVDPTQWKRLQMLQESEDMRLLRAKRAKAAAADSSDDDDESSGSE
eukprot:TRINITY_DN98304_c0_g1_i1.p1 TRINITY_DN98304_c0_g1~~TRINITY_DN98304_c0_g1_i1.p1  ORF type:complete len:400 (-),score=44.97 TRINITY_DN98304_c0_g1_i1:117-1253(-)